MAHDLFDSTVILSYQHEDTTHISFDRQHLATAREITPLIFVFYQIDIFVLNPSLYLVYSQLEQFVREEADAGCKAVCLKSREIAV